MDRTRIKSCIASDRISNLPCNVIDDILKHLPLHDAVRTSILSRGWQYKWLSTPCLVFDRKFMQKLHKDFNTESVIYQVLLVHKGPIVKFTFEADYYYVNRRSSANHLLHFLSNHPIQELTLQFPRSEIDRPMPYHLFTFDHLRHLHLVSCALKPPSTFEGFGRLVRLHLSNVLTAPGEFRRFISKCPILEHLDLDSNHSSMTFADLEIDAPNLKSFCFCCYDKLPSIYFISTSLLEELSIILYESFSPASYQGLETNLNEFLAQLSSIKKLKLSFDFLEFLARGGVPQKLPYNLSHLIDLQLLNIDFGSIAGVSCALCLISSSPNLCTLEIKSSMYHDSNVKHSAHLPYNLSHLLVLRLFEIDFVSLAEVSCAVCLIRSSPNLESLQIKSKTHRGDVKPAAQFLKGQKNCTLSHLKNVEFDGFSGSKPEMEFVKLLLSSATALIKLELKLVYRKRPATKKETQMLKHLERFPRASSKAEIFTCRSFR